MFRLIATDIDGTLLNSKKEITERTQRALIAVQQRGVKLVIATGRPECAVKAFSERLMLEKFGGYIMSFNGAKIVSAAQPEKPLLEKRFPAEYLPEICELIKGEDVGISGYEGDTIIAANRLTAYTVNNSKILGLPCKYVGENLSEYVNFPINKCLLSGAPEVISRVGLALRERFYGRLSCFCSEPFLLEIVSPDVSKGAALAFLAEKLSVADSECMAFGDNDNDVSMIKYAGMGIAMSNGSFNAKQAARIIAESNDNDGLALAVEKMCLNDF